MPIELGILQIAFGVAYQDDQPVKNQEMIVFLGSKTTGSSGCFLTASNGRKSRKIRYSCLLTRP